MNIHITKDKRRNLFDARLWTTLAPSFNLRAADASGMVCSRGLSKSWLGWAHTSLLVKISLFLLLSIHNACSTIDIGDIISQILTLISIKQCQNQFECHAVKLDVVKPRRLSPIQLLNLALWSLSRMHAYSLSFLVAHLQAINPVYWRSAPRILIALAYPDCHHVPPVLLSSTIIIIVKIVT